MENTRAGMSIAVALVEDLIALKSKRKLVAMVMIFSLLIPTGSVLMKVNVFHLITFVTIRSITLDHQMNASKTATNRENFPRSMASI